MLGLIANDTHLQLRLGYKVAILLVSGPKWELINTLQWQSVINRITALAFRLIF